ncbi:hypothetical protein FF38_07502 [Lucilia cuprina]|uniref:Uncharacterized protein n=1 Tax=Lucilia cuprina TaxID=7375 RepID=A0A0L0C909_LUCCU|nr:hypothetical protein FF38_07502 [Lucilia cuprina]
MDKAGLQPRRWVSVGSVTAPTQQNLYLPDNTLGPAKADIKMVIQDNMFGMGALNVDKSKTLCLIGPDNNGKQLLCNIIASELDVLKSIRKEDKIMVVGTSNLPWSANASFKKVFQNMLLIPESDYGTIFLMWLELITQNVASEYFEDCMLSVLAKIFQKYNAGEITDCVGNILKIERRMRLHTDTLNPNEFLEYLISRSYPIFPLEEKVN